MYCSVEKRGNIDVSLQCLADSLRTTLARCTPTVSCHASGHICKSDRYEEDIENRRDVTGAGIVKIEKGRHLQRERHLVGQQERRVQREEERAEPGEVMFSLLRRDVAVL